MKRRPRLEAVGIIVAMPQEFAAICQELLPQAVPLDLETSQVAIGMDDGVRYIIVQSGIGTTNAAVGTCDLLHRFSPPLVLNLGTAALIADPTESLQVADVLIGQEHRQWDLDIGGPVTSEWTNKRSFVDVLQTDVLRPDAELYELAKALLVPARVKGKEADMYTGNSFFVSEKQHQLLPLGAGKVMGVDMESFAVAQVCARKQIPFLCLRGISDTGTDSANQDFYANVRAASVAAARLAARLIKAWNMREE